MSICIYIYILYDHGSAEDFFVLDSGGKSMHILCLSKSKNTDSLQ